MISKFKRLKLCAFIMRLKYVLWLQTDFYGEEGGLCAGDCSFCTITPESTASNSSYL